MLRPLNRVYSGTEPGTTVFGYRTRRRPWHEGGEIGGSLSPLPADRLRSDTGGVGGLTGLETRLHFDILSAVDAGPIDVFTDVIEGVAGDCDLGLAGIRGLKGQLNPSGLL